MTDYSSFEDIDAEYLDLLWQPDLKIANLVDFEIQEVLKPLKGFTVFGSGLVYHSLDATATISCGMEFSRYPMDSQVCEFMVSQVFRRIYVNVTIQVLAGDELQLRFS